MCRLAITPLVGVSLLTASLGGCEDSTAPGRVPIKVDATFRDTIYAIHQLTITVREPEGMFARGVEVRVQTGGGNFWGLVQRTDDSVFRFTAVDTTDLVGRVSLRTQLQFQAGPGHLIVTVPALGYVDTVTFTVDPGRPVGVRVSPADTALYAARDFALRPYGVDRVNNPIANLPFEFSHISGPVTVNAAGTVSTTGIGRAAVAVRASGVTDTAWVSVVPEAWVATQKFYPGNGGPEGIFLMQLDGSGRDSLTRGLNNSFVPHGFGWSPDGQQLILPRTTMLFLLQPGGVEQQLVEMTAELNTAARFSRDGQWVYFALAYSSATQRSGLYRIRLDGTSLMHLGDDTSHFGTDYFASPSHDGLSVAYSSTRSPCFSNPCIRVLDLATNRDRVYGGQDYLVGGDMAAWSPVEDLIAYSSGSEVRLIRSTGTPVRVVASDAGMVKWMEWSPDGRWLIVAADFGVVLFDIQNVVRLPLAQFSSYSATIWRP